MERLGLWGSGTAFKDFTPFLDSITRRGLGKFAGRFLSWCAYFHLQDLSESSVHLFLLLRCSPLSSIPDVCVSVLILLTVFLDSSWKL